MIYGYENMRDMAYRIYGYETYEDLKDMASWIYEYEGYGRLAIRI